jgi:hypothetical protein
MSVTLKATAKQIIQGFRIFITDAHYFTHCFLKAKALEGRHFGKTLKFTDLELGIKTLQRCDTLIDKLRQQSTNESDKISLGVIASEVYANGVHMAFEASDVALKKKTYRELAFYFAEKSKSAVLLEAISESDAKSFAGIPAPLLEEEKKSEICHCPHRSKAGTKNLHPKKKSI